MTTRDLRYQLQRRRQPSSLLLGHDARYANQETSPRDEASLQAILQSHLLLEPLQALRLRRSAVDTPLLQLLALTQRCSFGGEVIGLRRSLRLTRLEDMVTTQPRALSARLLCAATSLRLKRLEALSHDVLAAVLRCPSWALPLPPWNLYEYK
jgi:hypothetical protein